MLTISSIPSIVNSLLEEVTKTSVICSPLTDRHVWRRRREVNPLSERALLLGPSWVDARHDLRRVRLDATPWSTGATGGVGGTLT